MGCILRGMTPSYVLIENCVAQKGNNCVLTLAGGPLLVQLEVTHDFTMSTLALGL